jgi:flagellar biosynthesis/type III secretory pathway chaperone
MATLIELEEIVVNKTNKVAKLICRITKKANEIAALEESHVQIDSEIEQLKNSKNVLISELEAAQQSFVEAVNKLGSHKDYSDV